MILEVANPIFYFFGSICLLFAIIDWIRNKRISTIIDILFAITALLLSIIKT